MPNRPPFLALLVALVVLLAACGGANGSPTPAPTPTQGPVVTPEDSVAAVVRREPRLTGIGPFDPDIIGQSAGYEVAAASGVGAFLVSVRVGWGDCQAGCINEHTWVYAVLPDGGVTLQSEGGDVVPPDAWPSPGGDGRTGLAIIATAGPTCPVETIPPKPECAPRPVPGAEVVIRDAAGAEVARVMLDAGGFAFVEVPAGAYQVEGLAANGLMGTPAPIDVMVTDGGATSVPLDYDTGIR
ncbi:MAG: carboxypeptidase-like regulatory domain-containing protein [Candidatus Limnocylindrales bacterium]